MPSKLDQLRSMSTVVVDAGDIRTIREFRPVDCTYSAASVLEALQAPEAIAVGQIARTFREMHVEDGFECVAAHLIVLQCVALAGLVPGRLAADDGKVNRKL